MVSVDVLGLQVLDSSKKGSIVLRKVKFPHLGWSGMLVIAANYKKKKSGTASENIQLTSTWTVVPDFRGLGATGQLEKTSLLEGSRLKETP